MNGLQILTQGCGTNGHGRPGLSGHENMGVRLIKEPRNLQRFSRCEAARLCIQGTVDIASILGSGGLETDLGFACLDDLLNYLLVGQDHHQSVKGLIPPDTCVNDTLNDSFKMKVRNHWLRQGYWGFAILVIAPVCIEDHPHESEWPEAEWVYAESYEQVFEIAVEWAETVTKNMKRKA